MYRPFGFNLGGFVDVWCPSSHRIYHASLDNGTLEQFATNSSSLESLKAVRTLIPDSKTPQYGWNVGPNPTGKPARADVPSGLPSYAQSL